jgi:ferredoxin-NADP reductase
MLHALAAGRATRPVLWLHAAQNRRHHAFGPEARGLMALLAHGRSYISYSRPDPQDRMGQDFDAAGYFSAAVFNQIGVSPDADVYLCGPPRFMTDMKAALAAVGVAPDRIHVELFNGSEARTPGVISAPVRPPHPPEGENAEADTDAAKGPLVSFARSGIAAHWTPSYQSILELAEACDVPVRWSCRAGICHNCESGLVSGKVAYDPQPLDMPAEGNLLVCCSRPTGDIVVDL